MSEFVAEPPVEATSGDPPAAFVGDIDLSAPHEGVVRFRRQADLAEAWLLVRFFDEPIGFVKTDLASVPTDELLLATLRDACADRLAPRLVALGLSALPLPPDRLPPGIASPYLEARRQVLEAAEHITVVICTRERPQELGRALMSLAAQEYPAFDVLVVDNAPTSTAVADVVAGMAEH